MTSRKRKPRAKPPAHREQMLQKPPRTARQVVCRVLEHCERTREFFAEPLDRMTSEANLGPLDRRLAREMVAGIVRRQATLDALIAPHVQRPRENVEDPLWRLLRMGAYELAFLESIPPHASVNETTELARYLRRPRWTGFLNGTLRAIARSFSEDTSHQPAADAYPLSSGRYRKCAERCFPDPQFDPCGYFASAFSFPAWLAERWLVGRNASELFELGFWFNAVPPIWLRVNLLKTTRADLLERFAAAGIAAEAGELPQSLLLKDHRNITELPGFAQGHFSVQDVTAMKAVELLRPEPGESIWDVCAAPGTKTAAIAERMQNQGRVLATDISAARLALIEDNRTRLGLDSIAIGTISAKGDDFPAGPFDAALVDVPCSNTGVLGKRPEARWRLSPNDFRELPEIQTRLLAAACARVRPGGRVVYSTCSIEPEENQAIVQAVLSQQPAWKLIEQTTHWPGQPADGGFAALLIRQL